ncbi:MAG: hypothetical protein ACYSX1_09030 [Planctomycetota bacterium]|jgi:hypothetical protein
MHELLTDARLIVGAIITVIVGVVFYRLGRRGPTKKFAYELQTNERVLGLANREELKDVQILYKGRPVEDVRLLILKFVNNGHQHIKGDDFQGSVTVQLEEGAEILTVGLQETHPEGLSVAFQLPVHSNKTLVDFDLFNAGDWVTMKFLATGSKGDLSVDGRIAGVSRITRIDRITRRERISLFIAMGVLALGAIGTWLNLVRAASQGTVPTLGQLWPPVLLVAGLIYSFGLEYSWRVRDARDRSRR